MGVFILETKVFYSIVLRMSTIFIVELNLLASMNVISYCQQAKRTFVEKHFRAKCHRCVIALMSTDIIVWQDCLWPSSQVEEVGEAGRLEAVEEDHLKVVEVERHLQLHWHHRFGTELPDLVEHQDHRPHHQDQEEHP